MAFDAGFEIVDALFKVLTFDLLPGMGVAVGAGVEHIGVFMAHGAFDLTLATVIEREDVACQLGRRPGFGGMAAATVKAESAGMQCRLGMTTDALAHRA